MQRSKLAVPLRDDPRRLCRAGVAELAYFDQVELKRLRSEVLDLSDRRAGDGDPSPFRRDLVLGGLRGELIPLIHGRADFARETLARFDEDLELDRVAGQFGFANQRFDEILLVPQLVELLG